MVSDQSKMDRNNPHHRRIPLYCSRSTQTQLDKSDYEAESVTDTSDPDFPPIRIRKGMSLASAMRRDPHQLRDPYQLPQSNKEEPPQSHRHQQCNTGLGQTNILNVVDVAAPVQHLKVTLYTF